MPVFRLGENSYAGMCATYGISYFSWLDNLRKMLNKELSVGTIDLKNAELEKAQQDPNDFHRHAGADQFYDRSDTLCILKGSIVCSLEICVVGSHFSVGTLNPDPLSGYVEAPAPDESLIDAGLLGRARAIAGPKETEPVKEIDPYTPLRWHIIIRQRENTFTFQGGVFDESHIEDAFSSFIEMFAPEENAPEKVSE